MLGLHLSVASDGQFVTRRHHQPDHFSMLSGNWAISTILTSTLRPVAIALCPPDQIPPPRCLLLPFFLALLRGSLGGTKACIATPFCKNRWPTWRPAYWTRCALERPPMHDSEPTYNHRWYNCSRRISMLHARHI